MDEQGEWVRRTVQFVQGNSHRITIPQAFVENGADQVEEVDERVTGQYLVVKPADMTKIEVDGVPFPDNLHKLDPERDADAIQSFVANALQSRIIAGVETVDVEFPEDIGRELWEAYRDAWVTEQERSDRLRWDIDEKAIEIRDGQPFEDYVSHVRQYLHLNLLSHLPKDELTVFEDRLQGANVAEKEANIDIQWALTTRMIGNRFLTLQRGNFPQALCGIYIAKYLEMVVDITNRLIESLAELEREFSGQPELIKWVRDRIHAVLPSDRASEEAFDKQLEEIANASFDLDLSNQAYLFQTQLYKSRVEKLDAHRSLETSSDFDNVVTITEHLSETVETERAVYAGVQVGKIFTLVERLIRFPRSIGLVGLGARHVADVHDIHA